MPSTDWVAPVVSCGRLRHHFILADLGYNGDDWAQHWLHNYAVEVLTPPHCERHSARVWFSSLRQAVETAYAAPCDGFGLQFLKAHTRWGRLTRIGAKLTACNLGILVNRRCGRPDLAFATAVI